VANRILVISHDPLARRAIAELVRSIPETEVVAEAESGAAALASDQPRVDALVWESDWNSSELRRFSDFRRVGLPVVALAATFEQARRLRAAGAAAVLSRGVDASGLAAALAAVLEGLVVSDPTLEPAPGEPFDLGEAGESLTPRELEVLNLVAEGLSNKAIAARLGIRESTVKDHVNSMLDKLGAQSRTEAVTVALRRGLIAI
jgi:DNA-binding NarL/FixJ family response regulator